MVLITQFLAGLSVILVVSILLGIDLANLGLGAATGLISSFLGSQQYNLAKNQLNQTQNQWNQHELGGWFSVLATVAAVIIAAYTGYLSLTRTTGLFNITAREMLQYTNIAFKTVSSAQEGEMIALQKETERFIQMEQEQTAWYEKALKELFPGSNSVDADSLLRSVTEGYINFGESPDDYFNRTIHAGNGGTAVLEVPGSYVDVMLKLPDSQQIILQSQRPEWSST